jgi:hypothetical protein
MTAPDQSDLVCYANCMEEIKRRQFAVAQIISRKLTTPFEYTNAEFAALQVRKILELIVMAYVASNRQVMGSLFELATGTWRIKRIVEIVGRANPKFYPRPIIQRRDPQKQKPIEWISKPDGWLTQTELISAYDEMGQFLHANSPYGQAANPKELMQRAQDILDRVVALLNEHVIDMPGGSHCLNVMMNASADGRDPNGRVSCSIFAKVA